MFDKPTRTAIKINTTNFGDGLAGRGLGLNNTIAELRPLVTNAVPVLHNLASPQTGLARVLRSARPSRLPDSPGGGKPSELLHRPRHLLHRLGEGRALDRRSERGRSRLARTGDLLAAPRGDLLRKRDRVHEPAAPERGRPAHRRAGTRPRLHRRRRQPRRRHRAQHSAGANPPRRLPNSAKTRSSRSASKTSSRRSKSATRCSRASRPSRSNCNYWTLAFRNLASLESENIGIGTLARTGFVLSPTGKTTRAIPSSAPANGPSKEHVAGSSKIVDPTTTTCTPTPTRTSTGPGQAQVCEAGNETYVPGS